MSTKFVEAVNGVVELPTIKLEDRYIVEVDGEPEAINGRVVCHLPQGKRRIKRDGEYVGYEVGAVVDTTFEFDGVSVSDLIKIVAQQQATKLDIEKDVEDVYLVSELIARERKAAKSQAEREAEFAAKTASIMDGWGVEEIMAFAKLANDQKALVLAGKRKLPGRE